MLQVMCIYSAIYIYVCVCVCVCVYIYIYIWHSIIRRNINSNICTGTDPEHQDGHTSDIDVCKHLNSKPYHDSRNTFQVTNFSPCNLFNACILALYVH